MSKIRALTNHSVNSSADCLTPKGFTFMRVKIAEGAVIDMYNLHADAGYVQLTCSNPTAAN
jgi:hypothetical protein